MQINEPQPVVPMNEVVWDKDGGKGCGMAIVKLAGLTLLSAAALAAGIKLGVMALEFVWSL